jgi:hypothetical protein
MQQGIIMLVQLTLDFVEVEQLLVGTVAVGGEVVKHILGLQAKA